jgi:nucleoid-associated protein YgaU
MATQADIAAALQRAGVTVYGLQVSGNQVAGTVGSEDERSKAYSAIAGVDNSASLNIAIDPAFQQQAANAAAAGTRSYTVKGGDTLSKIAKEHYGDASQWKRIFEANRGTISDPDKIQIGQQLTIPG